MTALELLIKHKEALIDNAQYTLANSSLLIRMFRAAAEEPRDEDEVLHIKSMLEFIEANDKKTNRFLRRLIRELKSLRATLNDRTPLQ